MTQWRALSDAEVVELAARLRSLDCTWELGAELVGDHGLDPALRVGKAGSRLIVEAGWQPPQDTAHGHNWWVPSCPGRRRRCRLLSDPRQVGPFLLALLDADERPVRHDDWRSVRDDEALCAAARAFLDAD